MELREWLIILGLVLVATIVIDGVRRLQRQRRVPRLDRAIGESDADAGSERDPDEAARAAEINWELPNGGARVVRPATFERSEDSSEPIRPTEAKRQQRIPDEEVPHSVLDRGRRTALADMQHNVKSAMRAGAKRVSESAQRFGQKREGVALDDERGDSFHAEPTLDASQAETPSLEEVRAEVSANRRDDSGDSLRITSLTPWNTQRPEQNADATPVADDAVTEASRADAASFEEVRVEPELEMPVAQAEPEMPSEPVVHRDVVTQHPAVERAKRHHVSAERARETLAHADEVIVISVLARTEDGFDGTTLLNLMLACGLRFSEMGIFHRYETEASDSELQFSMVNVLKPGVFDLDKMHEIVTPGVTFLMPLPGANDTSAAFEAMLETAMVLVRNLGGELKDENHSVMTAQTIEFARQRVQDFERRHRLHRYHAN